MKEKWQKILNIFSLVLLIFCAVKISSLENDIANLKNTVNNNNSMLQNSIDNINGSVRYELKQAANLVTDSDYEVISANIENATAALSCYIIPKEYNPDTTAVSLVSNGTEIPMEYENGRYIAEITVPLFDTFSVESVHFIDNGTIRTQKLNWQSDPKEYVLPQITSHASGSVTSRREDGFAERTYNQSIFIDISIPAENIEIVKAELVAETDYKETFRKNLEWAITHTDTENGKPFTHGLTTCDATLDEKFEVPFNSNFRMYTELTDNMGLVYRNIIEDVTIADNGEPMDNYNYMGYEADIYTSDGKPLYLKANDSEYN